MALLELLDSLPEPVVPASLHLQCTLMTSRDEAFEVCCLYIVCFRLRYDDASHQLLDAFPPYSVNVSHGAYFVRYDSKSNGTLRCGYL